MQALPSASTQIAYPGMTANFDVAKSAALALTMLDWREHGQDYAKAMVRVAKALAQELDKNGVPVFAGAGGFTTSHQFAVKAEKFGGGQTASKKLRKANLLVSGIGLPIPAVAGDLNGIRFGTPEIVRWGVDEKDAPQLAEFIAKALASNDPAEPCSPKSPNSAPSSTSCTTSFKLEDATPLRLNFALRPRIGRSWSKLCPQRRPRHQRFASGFMPWPSWCSAWSLWVAPPA